MCCSQQVACDTAGVRSSASITFFLFQDHQAQLTMSLLGGSSHWPSLNSLTDGLTHGTKCLAITLPHCHIRRTLISGLLNVMISKKWRLSLVRRAFALLSASNLVLSVRKKRHTLHWWPACGCPSILKKCNLTGSIWGQGAVCQPEAKTFTSHVLVNSAVYILQSFACQ